LVLIIEIRPIVRGAKPAQAAGIASTLLLAPSTRFHALLFLRKNSANWR
jgi:hypothetical protein